VPWPAPLPVQLLLWPPSCKEQRFVKTTNECAEDQGLGNREMRGARATGQREDEREQVLVRCKPAVLAREQLRSFALVPEAATALRT